MTKIANHGVFVIFVLLDGARVDDVERAGDVRWCGKEVAEAGVGDMLDEIGVIVEEVFAGLLSEL